MNRRPLLFGAGILAVVAAIYAPALGGQLLWNDPDYVTKAALQSWHGLFRIWSEVGATEQYYPALHSVFWLEHRLWGDAAAGYHWTNVGWHALAACLLALTLRRLWAGSGSVLAGPCGERAAWVAALIFAVHPVEAESVAWISEQKNTLSLVLYLAAALAYLRFDRDRRPAAYALGTVAFVLAILSKSVAATLPVALLVALWWQRGRLEWARDVRPLVPWFALGAAVGLFTAWVERTYIGAQGPAFDLDPAQRSLLAGRIVWFYLGKLVWPTPLIFFYPRWTIDLHAAWQYLFPAAVVAVTAGLWARRGRSRGPLAVWLFFVGSLFPTLGFFNVYAFVFSYVADHWQYLPSLGIIAGGAAAWELALYRRSDLPPIGVAAPAAPRPASAGKWSALRASAAHSVLQLAPVAVAAILGALTWRQARIYRDVETLYRDTVARNPDAWMAHSNLGVLLAARHDPAGAEREYRVAARLAPAYPEIHGNLGDVLLAQGQVAGAVAEYRAALAIAPNYLAAQVNLATTLALAGQLGPAIDAYAAALRLQPASADLRRNLAALRYRRANDLANSGQVAAAEQEYRLALGVQPDFPEARANLGLALATLGRPTDALPELREAIRLRPAYAEAHAYLGYALSHAGQPREAVAEYRTALQLNPRDEDARSQLEALLLIVGGGR